MIERLTPEEYERRKVTDTSAQEEYLDKQLAYEQSQLAYIYGDPVEEPAPEEEPPVQYVPVGVENAEKVIPWGLIGVIAITGLIALSIVAIVAVKR